MKSLLPLAFAAALAHPGVAMADEHCRRPMAEWQSREAVHAFALERGITPERLRIDDGCYDIRGRDADGNRVQLRIRPDSFEILELEVHFRSGGRSERYLPLVKPQAAPHTAAPR